MRLAILHNCSPLLFSRLPSDSVLTPPPLCSRPLSIISTLDFRLHGSLCQEFIPSDFILSHKRCQVELAGLHITQTARLLTSQLRCHTHLHEIKHIVQYKTSSTCTVEINVYFWTESQYTHTHAVAQECKPTPLPWHGGPICRICQDLTGNANQSQSTCYVSKICCHGKNK